MHTSRTNKTPVPFPRGACSALLLALLLLISACSAVDDASFETGEEELGSLSSALTSGTFGPWTTIFHADQDLQMAGDPVVCRANFEPDAYAGGVILLQRGFYNRYRASFMSRSPYTEWVQLGGQQFSSKPACAALDGIGSHGTLTSNQFAVFGKSSSNNRYLVRVMKLGEANGFGVPPDPPTLIHDWEEVSSVSYASAPASTVQNGTLYVVGRKSNNTISLHQRYLVTTIPSDPFGSFSWSGEIVAPSLPSGCLPDGDPAMIHTGSMSVALIATRARKAYPSASCAGIYFKSTLAFSSWPWQAVNTGVNVDSDPTLEVGTNQLLATLYFRADDNRIYQASVNVAGGSPWSFEAFTSVGTETFAGSPGAVGGAVGLDGSHVVFAKKSNGYDKVYRSATCNTCNE